MRIRVVYKLTVTSSDVVFVNYDRVYSSLHSPSNHERFVRLLPSFFVSLILNVPRSHGVIDGGGNPDPPFQSPSKRTKTGKRMRIVSPIPGTEDNVAPQSEAGRQAPADAPQDGDSQKEVVSSDNAGPSEGSQTEATRSGDGEDDEDEGRVKNKCAYLFTLPLPR